VCPPVVAFGGLGGDTRRPGVALGVIVLRPVAGLPVMVRGRT